MSATGDAREIRSGNWAHRRFIVRLCTGRRQLHPVLDCMAMVLGRMPQYFLPYAAQSIVISMIQFINATAFELVAEEMPLKEGITSFASYK